MKHYIIAKYNDTVKDKQELLPEIKALFDDADKISGVHGVKIYPSVTDRPNRYDIMIELDMDAEALPAWDASEVHKKWKAGYGKYLESKAIFDRAD
jgi:hypothetical protein